MRIVVVVQREPNLLEIVLALRTAGRFACLLDRRKQQGNQDGNDRDDDQQFNERKTATTEMHLELL